MSSARTCWGSLQCSPDPLAGSWGNIKGGERGDGRAGGEERAGEKEGKEGGGGGGVYIYYYSKAANSVGFPLRMKILATVLPEYTAKLFHHLCIIAASWRNCYEVSHTALLLALSMCVVSVCDDADDDDVDDIIGSVTSQLTQLRRPFVAIYTAAKPRVVRRAVIIPLCFITTGSYYRPSPQQYADAR